MRVAVYYRVSTKDKQSFASQKHAVEEWLRKNRLTAKYTIEDKESGASERRPGYKKIIDLALKNRIDAVVCYKLDRFGRNAHAVIKRVIEIEEMGVHFIAIETPALNTLDKLPFRSVFLSAFAEIAEIEKENIRDRIKAGLNAARKRNVKLGRPSKVNDPENQKAVIRLRSQKFSIRKIAAITGLSTITVQNILSKFS